MLEDLVIHPTAVVGKGHDRRLADPPDGHADMPVRLDAVEGVDQEVEHDLLDFLRIDHHRQIGAVVDLDRAPGEPPDMAEHLGDILHQAHDRRRLAADLTEPGEIEELLGDPLAAERLGLDQLEVAARHPGFVVVGHEAGEPALQRFSAHRDRGERIVDLVGNPRGEEADTRQLLAADHLARPQLDLPVEVVADLLEALRHVIEGLGELRHLVAAVEVEPEGEVAGGHAPGAVAEEAERPEHPAVGEDAERRQ